MVQLGLAGARADGSAVAAMIEVFDATGVSIGAENRASDLILDDAALGADLTGLATLDVIIDAGFDHACDLRNLERRDDQGVGVPPGCGPDGKLGEVMASYETTVFIASTRRATSSSRWTALP